VSTREFPRLSPRIVPADTRRYQWCGHNTFQGSGYDTLVEDYSDFSIPIFFTEFGCNEAPPREWEEVASLYHKNMTGVFSGGLVYEYSQESNNYGLVDIAKNGQVKTRLDYMTLQKAYAALPEDITVPSDLKLVKRPEVCPPSDDPIFDHITANHTLPWTLGEDMIKNGVADKVTRGKFVDVSTRATKYNIVMDGKVITDKGIKVDVKTADQKELADGGHGEETGGWNGNTSAADSNSASEDSQVDSSAVALAGSTTIVGSLLVVAVAFGLL
jgi:hypothetical protein